MFRKRLYQPAAPPKNSPEIGETTNAAWIAWSTVATGVAACADWSCPNVRGNATARAIAPARPAINPVR